MRVQVVVAVVVVFAAAGCDDRSDAASPAEPPTASSPTVGSSTSAGGSGKGTVGPFRTRPNPEGGVGVCGPTQASYGHRGAGTVVTVTLPGVEDVAVQVLGHDGGPITGTGFLIPAGGHGHTFVFPTVPFTQVSGVAVDATGDHGTGSCMAARIG
jgi:hypothetical protein